MSEQSNPVYLVGLIQVKDQEDYVQRYGMPMLRQLTELGAEMVCATAAPQVVEGDLGCNWFIIVRFPSQAVADMWYQSEEYKPYKRLRQQELTDGGLLFFAENFQLDAALRSLGLQAPGDVP